MSLREELTPAQRATALQHTIDPGFVHHRMIETYIGPSGMEIIDRYVRKIPPMPEGLRQTRIDHIYTQVFMIWCRELGVVSLGEMIATKRGQLFCSTEKLKPCKNIYEAERAISKWQPHGKYSQQVEFHYSTNLVRSSTLKSELYQGDIISIIGRLAKYDEKIIIFEPLIMGAPWLEAGDSQPDFDTMWLHYDFYENYVEDFDEFSKVKDIPTPTDSTPMRNISERAFKTCLVELLGGSQTTDWGGETSDFYTAHLHLNGVRLTGAFLLKGPARFAPMGLNHLGQNNDQIVRLAREPASVLFIQHSHDILPAVRETLRAFAVQPTNPRRYCLIDGRDSLRLLYAYSLFDKALALSSNP